uniref:Uncharacterized protein n=1 Tax=Amphimedon queenslandica TaxID=400682 RepID=A0A1X7U6Y5_AMPQE
MRGAPQYHILLRIKNTPIVSINRPGEVFSFIQNRITFHIPDIQDSICINDVENSLKSCNKIYCLKRIEKEVRVNNCNPLLLKLWRASMDLKYIAERSLSLTEYVSGYVTKAEKNSCTGLLG